MPLIGKQGHKPFFHYCKICPKVEFLSLKSIEYHMRFNDPERHKAKLLEMTQGEMYAMGGIAFKYFYLI